MDAQIGQGAGVKSWVLMACLVGAVALEAAPRPLDVRRRVAAIEERRSATQVQEVDRTERGPVRAPERAPEQPTAAVSGQRFRQQPQAGSAGPDASAMERREGRAAMPPVRAERLERPYEHANLDRRVFEGEQARLTQGAPVVTFANDQRAWESLAEPLSLQDINRFQFRRNRSSEPGLPVTPAGTANPPAKRRR